MIKVWYGVDFFHAVKYQSFLQVDITIFSW